MKIANAILDADQDVGGGKENERLIFIKNLLHAVITFFSFLETSCHELLLHQFVYFRFPQSGRMGLRRIPEMRAAAREPHVDVGVRIDVKAGEPQKASVVFLCLCNAIEKRSEFEWHNLGFYSELF